jgi:uncharacterized protein YecE (DUF72 family)
MEQKLQILIGISGYSYHEWVVTVYPEDTKERDVKIRF